MGRRPTRARTGVLDGPAMTAADQIEAVQAAAQDQETRGFQRLTEAHRLPTLLKLGWVLRFHGDDGLGRLDHPRRQIRLIHSIARELDGQVWAHISVSTRARKMPSWETVRDVFREVCGPNALGVIVVPPEGKHVNIGEVAHVWCCLTARPIPDFTHGLGTI